ncbi:hypothetical protein FLM9_100 [Candidatus Synechococcus spongiarum]|uniref:Uncharacterized protein n=1 Tax=Candidatus Synechococcus spongiarum TaxID=431041 RepID=A0A161KB47_9SYNE|nr:hypothetical protein FLM9_100 [Candidatus Synechococcus spongiarum]
MSLIALMPAVSFGLLTDLRGFRAEIKANLREFGQDAKEEIEAAIGGGNGSMNALRVEIKADNRKLASRMDSLDGRVDKLGADLNDRMDSLAAELSDRIEQIYQLLLPAKPEP